MGDETQLHILFVKLSTLVQECIHLEEGVSFFLIFYLFIHERHRRGRDTGRGRSSLHAGSPTWDSIQGLQDHTLAEGGAKPLSHRAAQEYLFIIHTKSLELS